MNIEGVAAQVGLGVPMASAALDHFRTRIAALAPPPEAPAPIVRRNA